MRFEAKNGYFKDLAHRIKNWSCYILFSIFFAAGGRVFKDFTTGPGRGYFYPVT